MTTIEYALLAILAIYREFLLIQKFPQLISKRQHIMSQVKQFLNAHALKNSFIPPLILGVYLYSFSIHKLNNENFDKIVYLKIDLAF